MKKTITLVLVLAICMVAKVANADFIFGEPTNLGPTVNSSNGDLGPSISADGLSLYFDSDRSGGSGNFDIWIATRETTNEPWGEPVNLGSTVNSSQIDWGACISFDGLELYFRSLRPGGYGGGDIWVAKRQTKNEPWGVPVNLGSTVNSSSAEDGPSLTGDGLNLFFTAHNRSGGHGNWDLWVTMRESIVDPWKQPVNLGPTINSSSGDNVPGISFDGRTLFFPSNRSNGFGNYDLYMTTRATLSDPWGEPVNLGPSVNTVYAEFCPRISADGLWLYFCDYISSRPGGYGGEDLWHAPILPIVDLNSDGIVDGADLSIIADHWGTDNSLCDIGPMPWGDGIVDVQDLIVIAEYLQPVTTEEINVNEENDGGQIELEQGQILVVTLESNPTTGYGWEVVENQESILEQMGEAEFKPSDTGEPPLVGAGGWEIFRFKAISAGQMTLQLIYHRSWEEGVEPVNTFSLDVIIH